MSAVDIGDLCPDIGERVLLLGPGPEWQEGTVRSSVSSCDKHWLRVESDGGHLFGFERKDGQSYWHENEDTVWSGGVPCNVKLRSARGSFTVLRMTPGSLAKRQRDHDIALCLDAYRKGVKSWAPDVLRRVAEVLRFYPHQATKEGR